MEVQQLGHAAAAAAQQEQASSAAQAAAATEIATQSVAVGKQHDMLRLRLAQLKQCRALVAVQLLRSCYENKLRLARWSSWFKWRGHVARAVRAEIDQRGAQLHQQELELLNQRVELEQRSAEVQTALRHCEDAVAQSRQREADAAELARTQEQQHRQIMDELAVKNAKLLAMNKASAVTRALYVCARRGVGC